MNKKVEKIDLDDVEKNLKKFVEDDKYGRDAETISNIIHKNPENKDVDIVITKMCLIDYANGTNLIKFLGKDGYIHELAERIISKEVNFDERVQNGDIKLVSELSKWCKEHLKCNLFSFMSKYCFYHNQKDFVIYDTILSEDLYEFISDEEFKEIRGEKLGKTSFKKMKQNFDYEYYKETIDKIIEKRGLKGKINYQKFDKYIWWRGKLKRGEIK